ncbi:MAG TPA: hypothetical protein VFD58_01155 [Blastocatellia bacterium]|nr:hypothetical protein [Blastocatellia bacterium]
MTMAPQAGVTRAARVIVDWVERGTAERGNARTAFAALFAQI